MAPNSPPDRINATFLTSAPSLRHCPPEGEPEVAFAGRSNAGKSSVLNQIAGHRGLAKVSKTPGRTQLINFFDVEPGGRLVDLPGYGYAKAGKAQQATWQHAVNDYLSNRDSLVGLVLVTDIRHPNQPYDLELIEWARASELPLRVLLNKADKLSFSKQKNALQAFNKRHGHPLLTAQRFSASKGEGRDELLFCLTEWLSSSLAANQ